MRITSQDETVDVNYDTCALWISENEDNGTWKIFADTGYYRPFELGTFPTEIAAIQEMTRIFNSWKMGCANHQVRKIE